MRSYSIKESHVGSAVSYFGIIRIYAILCQSFLFDFVILRLRIKARIRRNEFAYQAPKDIKTPCLHLLVYHAMHSGLVGPMLSYYGTVYTWGRCLHFTMSVVEKEWLPVAELRRRKIVHSPAKQRTCPAW